jgi:hypothetical protein
MAALLCLAGLSACGLGDEDKLHKGSGVDLSVDPPEHTFPATPIGDQAEAVFTVWHVGSEGTLALRSVRVEAAGGELSVVGVDVASARLEVNEALSFKVLYEPQDDQADEATLLIEHNSPIRVSPLEIPLRSLPPREQLIAFPPSVDFGVVESGEAAVEDIRLSNQGTRAVELHAIRVQGEANTDFALYPPASSLGLPRVVGPGEWMDVGVRYRPRDGDVDTGTAQVIGADNELQTVIRLLGREAGPEMIVSPEIVDFGEVHLGEERQEDIHIGNVGQRPLTVDAVLLDQAFTGYVTLVGAPSAPRQIAPGEELIVSVRFHPTGSFEVNASSIARVRVVGDDPGAPFVHVPVRGAVRLPKLTVKPNPMDFGRIAPEDSRRRSLYLLNNDPAAQAIEILSLEIDAPEGAVRWAEGAPALPLVLAPKAYTSLPLELTNLGGAAGEVITGRVRIDVADSSEPRVSVDLRAERADARYCALALEPEQVEFGFVSTAYVSDMQVALRNTGSWDCVIEDRGITHCDGAEASDCDPGAAPSPTLVFTQEAHPVSTLGAGEHALLPLRYVPANGAPMQGKSRRDRGLAMVYVVDPAQGDAPLEIPAVEDVAPPNVHGTTGESCLTVLPTRLDFGGVRLGCSSSVRVVHAHNTCPEELRVLEVELEDCGQEFKLVNLPYLPVALTPENEMNIQVAVFEPDQVGPRRCSLLIRTDEPITDTYVIPLSGSGIFSVAHEDLFTQSTGTPVDILFVVDDSGSMGDNQANLADNFDALTSLAEAWSSDFHLGVITTDASSPQWAGRLRGQPRYVTPEDWPAFEQNVKVGVTGSNDEQGLAAVELALTFPLTHESPVACSSAGDCNPPDECVDGQCGGYNRGFMRPDAVMHVVFVSDEDDHSEHTVSYYVDVLQGIKSGHEVSLVTAHAVVSTDGPSPAGSTCAHAPGYRYLDVAEALGGVTSDICDADWSGKLQALGEAIFGLSNRFVLNQSPDPLTVSVWVDDQPCAAGWSVDLATRSVVFSDDSPCFPPAGAAVRIAYESMCHHY